jgi:leucyl aminopeptidase (aminopeptidase T)
MELNKKLLDASNKALFDYLGLSEDETLLVLTDEKLQNIGRHLQEAAQGKCQEVFYLEMKSRETNGQEPPIQVTEMMKGVDVVIAPLYRSITHTDARRLASRLGVRVATMPNISEETMIRCLSAKASKIIDTTELIAGKMKGVETIRVTTKKGTDVTMPVHGRKIISSTGVLKKIGESGNLPSGEVFLAPVEGETFGTVVFDGSFAGIGLLKDDITVNIAKGYATSIEGGEQAKQLEEMLNKAGLDAFAVGEFGIGTNYKAKLSGTILEDEKVFGTIHIAFGNNVTMGGNIRIASHLDGLVKKPTVYFDDEMIMDKGKLVIE